MYPLRADDLNHKMFQTFEANENETAVTFPVTQKCLIS